MLKTPLSMMEKVFNTYIHFDSFGRKRSPGLDLNGHVGSNMWWKVYSTNSISKGKRSVCMLVIICWKNYLLEDMIQVLMFDYVFTFTFLPTVFFFLNVKEKMLLVLNVFKMVQLDYTLFLKTRWIVCVKLLWDIQ